MREDRRLYPSPPGVGVNLQPLLLSGDLMELRAFGIYNSSRGNITWSGRCSKLKVQARRHLTKLCKRELSLPRAYAPRNGPCTARAVINSLPEHVIILRTLAGGALVPIAFACRVQGDV